ncbi:hypothetical protein ACSYAD_29855 [Acaryochloris marina NIES-2412]|uniref:hypothetical protein n=1 Tax=Acaryochloris marina TaxID=155978 RepID=UPI004057F47E
MSDIYSDDIQSRVHPDLRNPVERSVVQIEDRTGWKHTEIIQGPPPRAGSRWDGRDGGTVTDSRPQY